MKIIVDTNVLMRYLSDAPQDNAQAEIAEAALMEATEVIIPTHVVCELI